MTGDPNPADPETTAEHYEKETKALEAQDNLHQTKDRIANPPSAVEARIKHEEELATRATAAEERARTAEEERRTADKDARKEAEDAAAQAHIDAEHAKDELHNHQLNMMSTKLDEVLQSRKNPQAQMEEYFSFADQMAEKMGWVKPGALQPASDNPQIALELAKIHLDDAHRQREHESKLAREAREWDMEKIKLNDSRAFETRKLDIEERKTDMLLAAPQTIGAAIIRGAMDRGGGSGRIEQERKDYRIEMSEGQGGEVQCPHCATKGKDINVGVGPTTTMAQCVGCNTQYPVVRLAANPEPPPPEE